MAEYTSHRSLLQIKSFPFSTEHQVAINWDWSFTNMFKNLYYAYSWLVMSRKSLLFRKTQDLIAKHYHIPNIGPECIFCLLESLLSLQPTLNPFSIFSGRKCASLKSLERKRERFYFLTHLQMCLHYVSLYLSALFSSGDWGFCHLLTGKICF